MKWYLFILANDLTIENRLWLIPAEYRKYFLRTKNSFRQRGNLNPGLLNLVTHQSLLVLLGKHRFPATPTLPLTLISRLTSRKIYIPSNNNPILGPDLKAV